MPADMLSAGYRFSAVFMHIFSAVSRVCRVQQASVEAKMAGSTIGMATARQTDRGRDGRFCRDNNARRSGAEKRAAMEAEIAAELGGNLSAADMLLLRRSVELLTKRPRGHTDAVRAVNAGSRVIAQLRQKYREETPTIEQMLAGIDDE
jgi:hypothetical protein